MKRGNAIEVHDIHKAFKVYSDRGHTLKEAIFFRKRNKYELRHVINGISFSVKEGEAIGLIGHNGCGKSTTLKMLTKIMYPDSGTIEMRGRVSSLIELGAGFHPEMTGRENIYINASIFGLTKKEIDARLEDIIAFSELEEYIDSPVRTYSSGMYMRLAFAVAINVDADILLIDEILAVGDAGFQAKCFNRLKEIKASGTTIVIVSHSLGQIEQICERSLWIHKGVVKAEGKPRDVHPLYMEYMAKKQQEQADKEAERQRARLEDTEEKVADNTTNTAKEDTKKKNIADTDTEQEKKIELTPVDDKRWGNGKGKIRKVEMVHAETQKSGASFMTGEKVIIRIEYEMKKKIEDADVGIGIFRIDGVQCYGTNTRIDRLDTYSLDGSGVVEFKIHSLDLLTGRYTLDVAVETDGGIAIDYWREALSFEMYSKISDVGVSRLSHKWSVK